MTYDELKAKRNSLQKMLDEHSDMKSHRTYKAVQQQLSEIRQQIKTVFRDQYNAKSGNN